MNFSQACRAAYLDDCSHSQMAELQAHAHAAVCAWEGYLQFALLLWNWISRITLAENILAECLMPTYLLGSMQKRGVHDRSVGGGGCGPTLHVRQRRPSCPQQ